MVIEIQQPRYGLVIDHLAVVTAVAQSGAS